MAGLGCVFNKDVSEKGCEISCSILCMNEGKGFVNQETLLNSIITLNHNGDSFSTRKCHIMVCQEKSLSIIKLHSVLYMK